MYKIMNYLLLTGAFFALTIIFFTDTARAEQPSFVQSGKKYFTRCAACHTLSSTSRTLTGPHLENIVGRKAASVHGFAYTKRLLSQSFVWDIAHLDRWLTKPQADFPGMCLPFTGLPKAQDRAALIAYLKNPAP